MRGVLCLIPLLIVTSACAGLTQLSQLVQPPRVTQADGHPAEIRLMGPTRALPAGGAGVRVWLDVANPNPFGFTLTTLSATLSLAGTRAATGDFPLGLRLSAGGSTVVPLDLSIAFTDLPGLGSALHQLTAGGTVDYELDGTVGIDAGRLGTPTFGPMRLTQGELRVIR